MSSRKSSEIIIISPCKNEEDYLPAAIESVTSQTILPKRWIIVDDASTDKTAEIIKEYSRKYPWIEYVLNDKKSSRKLGAAVVRVFNKGLEQLGDDDYNFILKMDVDLTFDNDLFERVIDLFEDEKLGMAGVALDLVVNGKKIGEERYADYHVCGAFKFYKKACFVDIGGPKPLYGWDILDETSARHKGWKTMHDPDIRVNHHRIQGASIGKVKGRINWGQGAYAVGSHPLFAIVRGFYRMLDRPFFIGGLAFIWGFFSSYFNSAIERNPDKKLIKYLRKEQIYRLFHGNRIPRDENNDD